MPQDSNPQLDELALDEALAQVTGQRPGHCIVTMGEGQWDELLAAAYSAGWTLLELNDEEKPVRAYCRKSH